MQNKRWLGTSSKPPRTPQHSQAPNARIRQGSRVYFAVQQDPLDEGRGLDNPDGEDTVKPRRFKHKFDPESDLDAFGRDPRKETEFWMGAAKSVLESEDVKQAIADHAEAGGDGLTDDQRAYMEFIKSLDQETEDKK
ncbi:hypothetical protein BWQ96_07289 [Gracilariopsis chorda]|uniref:Uncharacterized protein n=1 Tax=Gracilariopsis chorda TaxID=448386 RepID=A0A2V3ILM3_9FLOR|nr:hypothetical protein BWQ96_07289 [Gracilariopsis chorda]|eukprot:PXF42985.1 hypothetical protein BWQ96_07289 [Gracilariopsis chorda]